MDATSVHATIASPSGVGESGSAATWVTAASMMPSALLNSRFSGSSRAKTDPQAVVSIVSPAPNAMPNTTGSMNGSDSCVYRGSMNCMPRAVRQAPSSTGPVRVRSGAGRPTRFARTATAASTMPQPNRPQPVYTAKGCKEKAVSVSPSEKNRIALRKTENSSPAPSSAGLNETDVERARSETCCCALPMSSLQRRSVFPRRQRKSPNSAMGRPPGVRRANLEIIAFSDGGTLA